MDNGKRLLWLEMGENACCSDAGCVFGHPGGMATNGGCHCLERVIGPYLRARLYKLSRVARQALADVQALEEELARARAK